MVRPPYCDKPDLKKGLWSEEEDARMLEYLSKHGTGKWISVPKRAGLRRCGKSCRLRWNNYLRPDLKYESFTPKEEELIVKLHAAIGSRWAIIAQQLPGRTDNDVKNYWNTKLRKKLFEMGIDPVTHKPFSQILADYGNLGGLPKSGMRINISLNKDLKSAILMKTQPNVLPNTGKSSRRHFMPSPTTRTTLTNTTLSPKTEPTQDCSFLNDNKNFVPNDMSLNLLTQLQAIKLVTEASNFTTIINNDHESALLGFYPEATFSSSSSLSSSSSFSSSTCSSGGAHEMPPVAFNWDDFLLEDAFLPNEAQEQEKMAEFSISQNQIPETQIENEVSTTKDMDHDTISTINGVNSATSSCDESSFVETLLARENEMLLEFPELLAEAFY